MKHWQAFITVTQPDNSFKSYKATVPGLTEYDAINEFHKKYGPNCLIGWIKETKLYGLQSVGY